MNNFIITIGREHGSGGHIIGERLAKRIKFNCYDRKLIDRCSKESGISENLFEEADEKRVNIFKDSSIINQYGLFNSYYSYDDTLSYENLFLCKMEVIKNIANTENAVIVGRCADYILRDYKNVLSVFIYCSDMEQKKARVLSRGEDIKPEQVYNYIKKADKSRASYYYYYTDQKWGDIGNYNLCIDTARFGLDGTVDVIEKVYNSLICEDKN